MKISKYNYYSYLKAIGFSFVSTLITSCEDFIRIDPPRTDLIKSTVFATDATANAAMIDIYFELSRTGFASGNSSSISYIGTYSSDEQLNYSIGTLQEFNENELTASNVFVRSLWTEMYKTIFKANSLIEGVTKSRTISSSSRNQLVGEGKFIRAFCYFYLVNLWGDVPLVTSTDYRLNSNISRTPSEDVYFQIISDLQDAQELLPDGYLHANNERVRVNKSAASALMARTYLCINDWAKAESEATKVIESSMYKLPANLNEVFVANSQEAIWQFHTTFRPAEWATFLVTPSGPHAGVLRDEFVNNFEEGDQRFTVWVRSITDNSGSFFYFPGKYTSITLGGEFSTLLRLSEQYLIRAEARAHQNNIDGAQSDLNRIRHRAGLVGTGASDMTSLLLAIERERVVELFTEQGLRWIDLKRTNRADDVLAPIKSSTWQSTDVLYPIPEYELLNNQALRNAQNPGY